jgi:hypothetical protein
MAWLLRLILELRILSPVLRPVSRFVVGLIAIPLFRFFLKDVFRQDVLDQELEKDLEQWFRGSLVLLVATANMEPLLFGWVSRPADPTEPVAQATLKPPPDPTMGEEIDPFGIETEEASVAVKPASKKGHLPRWLVIALRLMLAIGVIEAMPDQALFSIIHPGPAKILFPKGQRLKALRENSWPILKGMLCRHLDRSSAVFTILAVLYPDTVGWVCYVIAITQFLIIGLVTSRDKAIDALSEFDRQVQMRRQQLAAQVGGGPDVGVGA